MRVFPLSNWTELDVWEYVQAENIPVVPLYFAKERPVVERSGTLIMVDDDRLPLMPGETPQMRKVRFRTLGCYPLSGAIEFEADTLRRHHRRDAQVHHLRAPGAPDRYRRGGLDGEEEARGVLLMNAPAPQGRRPLPSPSGRRCHAAGVTDEGLRRLAEIIGPYLSLRRLATHPHPAALRASTFSPREKGAHAAAQRKRCMNAPLRVSALPTLRVLTCGSVDDGKSTLIGRLLYEKKLIFDDQLSALEKDSKKFGTTERRDRLRAARRRARGRTRAGHHHRCRLSLFRHRSALLHRRRHARP